MARGRGSGKRSGSKPTSNARAKKQSTKERYAKAREDAQLAGIIPTTPEGALKDERVDPATQSEAPQVGLISQAIRQGWAVPEDVKPGLVDELVKIMDNPDMPAKVKVAAFNALRQADMAQHERDHPELKNGKGDTIIGSVNIQNNIQAAAVIKEMIQRGELGIIPEEPAPFITSTSGSE